MVGNAKAYSLEDLKDNKVREREVRFGVVSTFRGELLWQIEEAHLKNGEGEWLESRGGEALLIPMMEMACDSVEFVDECIYLNNHNEGQD